MSHTAPAWLVRLRSLVADLTTTLLRVAVLDVSERVGRLVERVDTIDHRGHVARLDHRREGREVGLVAFPFDGHM